MKTLTITFALLFSASIFAQQNFMPKTITNDFNEYQKQFDLWYKNAPKNQKGYKWIQRWLNFTETRTGAYGKLISTQSYLESAQQIASMNANNFGLRAIDSSWVPEGPDTLTGAYNPASSHGVARVNTIAFHPTDTNIYWVGVSQGGIWKTTNSGKSYFPVNEGLPILRISDIAVDKNHPDTLYASVCDYAYIAVALQTDGRKRNTHYGAGIYKSYDGGISWTPTGLTFQQTEFDNTLIRRIFVNPNNAQEIVCAGVEGVLKSLDGGLTWAKKYNGLIWDFEQNPENPNTLYTSSGYLFNLGIGEPKLMVSHDFGENWKTIGNIQFNSSEDMQRVELTISNSDTNYMYAVSSNRDGGLYGFYKSTDAGSTWVQQINGTTGPNVLEWYGGDGVGGQGTYDLTIYVDRNDRDKVFVGGVNVWGTSDGGISWDGCSYWLRYYGFTPHADQHFLTYNPLDSKYYLCNDGGIFRTDSIQIGSWDDANNLPNYKFPTQWEDVSSGMQITSLYRIGLCDSVNGYIISGAQDNGTFYRDNTGKWMNISGGDGMDGVIHRADPTQGISSSQFGRFYQFTNGGINLRNFNFNMIGDGAWTTPIEQHPQIPGDYYIGAEDISLVSRSQGTSIIGSLPKNGNDPISAFAICGQDANNLIVAKRPYFANNIPTRVYYTSNNGRTWNDITKGLPDSMFCTAVAIDDRNPQLIWATFGGFASGQKVFRSNDGGNSWINITDNLPNLPVNTIVQDIESEHNGIYIGCDVGIYYTNDTLKKWQLYNHSFPNVIVSDLEIQLKERRMYASTFGRGVWSVGLKDEIYVFPEDTIMEEDPKENSINDYTIFSNATFSLFPNPNKGLFKLSVNTPQTIDVSVSIVNIMGKQIFKQKAIFEKGSNDVQYNLGLEDGIYFLRIDAKNRSKVQRFLVIH